MTRIAREQMLCVVLPDWTHGSAPLRAADAALAAAFAATGVLHFVSLALLPPRPGAAPGSPPALLLELTVDEGLRPADTLAALTAAAVDPLWALLGSRACDGRAEPAARGDRVECLQDLLQRHCSVADGAFVGARNRHVERVLQERTLMRAVRQLAAALGPAVRQRADTLAHALAGDVLRQPALAWAREPVERSFWRQPRALGRFVFAYLVLPLLLCWGLAWALGWLAPHAKAWSAQVGWLVAVTAAFFDRIVDASVGLLRFVVGPLLWGLLALTLAGFIFGGLRRVYRDTDRLLDRPGPSRAAALAAALLGLALLALAADLAVRLWQWAAWAVFTWPRVQPDISGLWPLTWWQWALATLVVVALLALLGRIRQRTAAAAVPRAHQVHDEIAACEQRLHGRVQHLISLTEIRSPVAWHRWWLRRWLRLVSLAGRVVFTEGRLGGAWGIHFGHWHIIDNGTRLLFCSNYDGNFAGYLDDFILGASIGVNGVWRRTRLLPRGPATPESVPVLHEREYPPTRLWYWRGARCEQWFKTYARDSMVPHVLRWEAYTESLDALNRASGLRESLAGPRDMANNERLVRCLES